MQKAGSRIKIAAYWFVFIFFVSPYSSAWAASYILDIKDEERQPQALIVPYVFHSEILGWAYGVAAGSTGFLQKQMSVTGAYMQSSNGARAVYLFGRDVQLPATNRWFLNANFSIGRYPEQRGYFDGNPDFPDEDAGSNDSSEENFIAANGWDNWLELEFKYQFPIGHGRDTAIHGYVLDEGVLVKGATGGDNWNPMQTGLTDLVLTPFYRSQTYHLDEGDLHFIASGLKIGLHYNNTDFPDDPAQGSEQRIRVSHDPGNNEANDSWTVVDFEVKKFFPFSGGRFSRKQVLALDFWTATTPSWEQTETEDGIVVSHRPPHYMGATLGGLYRLRAYQPNRFNDKAAIYYSADYRYMLKWNGIGAMDIFRVFKIDWWQLSTFVEIGRVANEWNIQELHSEMKWDVGIGLRAMMSKAVLRFDIAGNDEVWEMWIMAGQPF